jgi:hypothetical protein
MASTYTNNGIELITTGEQSGTWGTTTNTNWNSAEAMITGYVDYTVTDASTKTETIADGAADDFRNKIIKMTGTLSQAQTITIADTSVEKEFWVHNGTTGGYAVTFKQGTGANTITINNGNWGHFFVNGANDAEFFTPEQFSTISVTTAINPDTSGGADLGTSSLEWGDVYVADGKFINFGSDQDVLIGWNTTRTGLDIAATEGAALALYLSADQGDDAGDEWKLNVANGGIITLGNDIASAGSFVTQLTVTPHATITSSTVAVAGKLTVADTIVATGTITGTLATAAQTAITSLGTLTALQIDNLNLNGNTLSSTAGTDLLITPLSGQQIVLDGTIVIDAGVVTGATSITSTAFVGDITGDVTGTSDVATVATTVTITDNESTDESNALIFTAGGDVDGGNLGLESDGTLTYNPSTGKITATGFVGTLTGNVTGNASGTAATVTTAAQTAITSLGTLTALQIDNLNLNGNTLSSTAGTDLLITPLSGQQIVLDGTIVIDAGVVTGATSITSTAFVGTIDGVLGGNTPAAMTGTTLTATGAISLDGGAFTFNDTGADLDFRVETDDNEYMFYIDGDKNAIVLGANTDVSSADNIVLIDSIARTASATVDFAHLKIASSNAVTIPSGTTALAAGLHIAVPNWTATGTITASASLYIAGAATEATTDYALWIDGGTARFDGAVEMENAAGPTLLNEAATTTNPTLVPDKAEVDTGIGWASDTLHFVGGGISEGSVGVAGTVFNDAGNDRNFRIESNDNANSFVIDGGTNFVGFGAAASTSVNYFIARSKAYTAAVDGDEYIAYIQSNSTAITTAGSGTHGVIATLGLNEPDITIGTAGVTNAATLLINNVATEATNNYALWVNAGNSRFDGTLIFDTASFSQLAFKGGQTIGDNPSATHQMQLRLGNSTDGGSFHFLLGATNYSALHLKQTGDGPGLSVFNDDGIDRDFRVECNTHADALFIEDNKITIGSLGGSGSRAVVADANGVLSAP